MEEPRSVRFIKGMLARAKDGNEDAVTWLRRWLRRNVKNLSQTELFRVTELLTEIRLDQHRRDNN